MAPSPGSLSVSAGGGFYISRALRFRREKLVCEASRAQKKVQVIVLNVPAGLDGDSGS